MSSVRLSVLENQHLSQTFQWLQSEELRARIDSLGALNWDGHVQYWQAALQDQCRRTFAILDSDQHVGNCGLVSLDRRRLRAELWIYVGEQGHHGVGTQAAEALLALAFKEEALHKVFVRVLENNKAGQSFFKKLGFTQEGYLRDDTVQNGIWISSFLFSLLEHEYRTRA